MGVRRSPKRWTQRGVRVRAAVAAVLGLAATLTLAAGALLWLLQSSAEDAASARAAQIALHLLSDPLPEIDPTVLATDGRTTVIHVLDTAGRVVASQRVPPPHRWSRCTPPPVPSSAWSHNNRRQLIGA